MAQPVSSSKKAVKTIWNCTQGKADSLCTLSSACSRLSSTLGSTSVIFFSSLPDFAILTLGQIKNSIRRTHLNIKLHSIKIAYSWKSMKEDNHYYYLGIQLIVNMQLTARFVALPKDSCRRRCRGAKRQHIAWSTDSFSPSLFGRCAPVCHSTQLWSHRKQTIPGHLCPAGAHSLVPCTFNLKTFDSLVVLRQDNLSCSVTPTCSSYFQTISFF